MTVDETFDADTAGRRRSWQDAIGVPETGAVGAGDAVFLPGPRRIGRLADVRRRAAAAGASRCSGDRRRRRSSSSTSTRASRSSPASARQVRVELPSGRVVAGTDRSVGKVAEVVDRAQGEPGRRRSSRRRSGSASPRSATGSTAHRSSSRSNAQRAKDVLAVPVEALLALRGRRRRSRGRQDATASTLTAVETGTFADGYVEIAGQGHRRRREVVVPE